MLNSERLSTWPTVATKFNIVDGGADTWTSESRKQARQWTVDTPRYPDAWIYRYEISRCGYQLPRSITNEPRVQNLIDIFLCLFFAFGSFIWHFQHCFIPHHTPKALFYIETIKVDIPVTTYTVVQWSDWPRTIRYDAMETWEYDLFNRLILHCQAVSKFTGSFILLQCIN